jgi:hypothetical protein
MLAEFLLVKGADAWLVWAAFYLNNGFDRKDEDNVEIIF